MDFEKQLDALKLTGDEITRLSDALKDPRFRELLTEYAAEISDPDSRRQYEEDIKRLEEDRGMDVQFIHPEGHHVLKTNSAERKCFINVCSSPLIAKPSCEATRNRDGKAGHNWTLPFSPTPGRPDRDAKGNTCMIYDVVFHPDVFHIAEKNEKLMKVIDSTATRGIEDSFQVKLENSNTKLINCKYKGVPHPTVIRKPIPGYMEKSTREEQALFPYPDETTTRAEPNVSPRTAPTLPSSPDKSSLSEQPTKPHYILKYRTIVDLQDYRNSRDSALSRRPKAIVIIIDLPLLKSANDVDVNLTQRHFVLESQTPSYKLELPLSFPVDEDKGQAMFNKTTKQMTITLPILPVEDNELPQIRFCEEERDGKSDDKARLMPHEKDTTQRHNTETQHKELNCDILTQATSETCELLNVAVESLCLPNNCPVSDMDCFNVTSDSNFNNSKKDPETDHISNNIKSNTKERKSESEITKMTTNPQRNYSFDLNINLQEVSKFKSIISDRTHDEEVVKPRYASERGQNATSELSAQEPLMTQGTSPIHQQSSSVARMSLNEQLNLFPTDKIQTLNSSDVTGPVSQKTATTHFSKEHKILTLNKETGVLSKKQVDVDGNSHPAALRETNSQGREVIICDYKTSAALCFQNSLWFDLDY